MNLTKKHEKNPCFITKTEYLPYCVAKLMMKCLPASKLSIAFSDTDQMLQVCLPNYYFLKWASFSFISWKFPTRFTNFVLHRWLRLPQDRPRGSFQQAGTSYSSDSSGCTGHSYVTSLNSRLCCVGRTLSWRAIECHRAALHRDSLFG